MSANKLFVITGPSGAGTGDILEKVLAKSGNTVTVMPVTARKMKEGEINGEGLLFYDLDEWNALIESGDLLECTEMMGNDYGTSRALVLKEFEKGNNVLLETEPERALQIRKNMPEAVCILVYPRDSGVLKERYAQKARSRYELPVRMEVAKRQTEIARLFCEREVDSGDADRACSEIISIINGD